MSEGRGNSECVCVYEKETSPILVPLCRGFTVLLHISGGRIFLWPKLSMHWTNVESCWIRWICSYLYCFFLLTKISLLHQFFKCNKKLLKYINSADFHIILSHMPMIFRARYAGNLQWTQAKWHNPENDTVQQMMQPTPGLIVFCIQAVI